MTWDECSFTCLMICSGFLAWLWGSHQSLPLSFFRFDHFEVIALHQARGFLFVSTRHKARKQDAGLARPARTEDGEQALADLLALFGLHETRSRGAHERLSPVDSPGKNAVG